MMRDSARAEVSTRETTREATAATGSGIACMASPSPLYARYVARDCNSRCRLSAQDVGGRPGVFSPAERRNDPHDAPRSAMVRRVAATISQKSLPIGASPRRAEQRAGFLAGLLVLGLRVGIGHHAAAGLDVHDPVPQEGGAERDARVEVAVVAEIPEDARVEAPLDRLLLRAHRPPSLASGPPNVAIRQAEPGLGLPSLGRARAWPGVVGSWSVASGSSAPRLCGARTRTRGRKRRKATENSTLTRSRLLSPLPQPVRNVATRHLSRPVRARSSNAWPNSRRPSRASPGRSAGCRTRPSRCSSPNAPRRAR